MDADAATGRPLADVIPDVRLTRLIASAGPEGPQAGAAGPGVRAAGKAALLPAEDGADLRPGRPAVRPADAAARRHAVQGARPDEVRVHRDAVARVPHPPDLDRDGRRHPGPGHPGPPERTPAGARGVRARGHRAAHEALPGAAAPLEAGIGAPSAEEREAGDPRAGGFLPAAAPAAVQGERGGAGHGPRARPAAADG